MSRLVKAALAGFWVFPQLSCEKPEAPISVLTTGEVKKVAQPLSEELLARFPLFPVIEPLLWKQLLEAEVQLEDALGNGELAESLMHETQRIASVLRERHPFREDEESVSLGELRLRKGDRVIEMLAEVVYPKEDPDGKQHEVELLVCTDLGRNHETIFQASVRPLHLELLLHLAGFAKGAEASQFQIVAVVPQYEPIPVGLLVERVDGKPLELPLRWEFSGSSFQNGYGPDGSGDVALFWQANDSVLSVVDRPIANGEVALKCVPHSELEDGMMVQLELRPMVQQ